MRVCVWRRYNAPTQQPFELDDMLVLATVYQSLKSFLGVVGSARCEPINVMQVDAAARTFVLHVRAEHVVAVQGALTLCTRTSTGKPCSFATLQSSSTLAALANPRHLQLDQFPAICDEEVEEEDGCSDGGGGGGGQRQHYEGGLAAAVYYVR